MWSCVVLEVARTRRGQLRPPEPSCPTWHLTGVCTACWSLVRGGPAHSDLHACVLDIEAAPAQPWGCLCLWPETSTAFFSGAHCSSM